MDLLRHVFSRSLGFSALAGLIAATFAALSLTLLVWPAVIHWLFQITSDPATDVMSRRAAVLFAGLATLMWQARGADDCPLRRSICLCIGGAMAGLALLGLIEFLRGGVGGGIWLAIAVELLFTMHLIRFWRGAA